MCLEVMHMCSMPTVHGKKNSSALIGLLMSARAAAWATSYSLAAVSQMTTKPGAVNNATTCKLGRMTLPACGHAHANWTIATFGGQTGWLPNVAKHKLGQPWPKTARRRIYI
jgi:hypothetical protein